MMKMYLLIFVFFMVAFTASNVFAANATYATHSSNASDYGPRKNHVGSGQQYGTFSFGQAGTYMGKPTYSTSKNSYLTSKQFLSSSVAY